MLLLSLRKINIHSSMLLFVFLVFFSLKITCENLCYMCGNESITPLIELNKTYIESSSIIEKSCEHFDKLLPHEREAFEIVCPRGMSGCITQIQSNKVMRTCSKIAIDDCKKVNGDLVCLCSKRLCNGEISDNIRKMFEHEFNQEDDNEEGDDDDEETLVESGDDVIQFAEETTGTIVSSSQTTTFINEVLMSTIRPSANKAVSFHFKNQLSTFYVLFFLQSFVIKNF